MVSPNGGNGGAYWTDGDMMFRVHGAGRELDRIVKVRRPFALIGRAPENDICINDPAVSDRHVYAHLDPRGAYVVDLLTRSGTRINGQNQSVGWLRPGQSLEIAGRRLTLVRMRIHGEARDPEPSDDDLLAETNQANLVGVALEPTRESEPPWSLGSELVFLGWSSSCGIQVQDKLVARAHCAIARTGSGAYLIDLCGQNTWLDDEEVIGAVPLRNGQTLMVGSTSFTVRIEPALEHLGLPAVTVAAPSTSTQLVALPHDLDIGIGGTAFPPFPLELVPADAHHALLAWMMGTIQGAQGEALRQQGEFQHAVTEVLREIQQENSRLLQTHQVRMENIVHELGALRAQIQERLLEPPDHPALEPPPLTPRATNGAAHAPGDTNGHGAHLNGHGHGAATLATTPTPATTPPALTVAPLKIDRTVTETDPRASAAWLLDRVNQAETENRSAWKDLLGRLSALPRRTH